VRASLRRWTGNERQEVAYFHGPTVQTRIYTLETVDLGSGPQLCVGGNFDYINSFLSSGAIALWNGLEWSPLGRLFMMQPDRPVRDVVVIDEGGRPVLYAVGAICPEGVGCHLVGRWDGEAWTFPSNLVNLSPNAVEVFDDGRGPAVFVTQTSGQVCLYKIVDGALIPATNIFPRPGPDPMAAFDDGSGPALWVGGSFSRIGPTNSSSISSARLAKLFPCTIKTCYPNCDDSTAAPFLNIADFVCFTQRFAAGDPYANCDGSTSPPILTASDFVCFQQQFAAGCP
jgi:hypothetical protein